MKLGSEVKNIAAGLLMCRISQGERQFFLVHPGGPYFMKKDAGVWSIPKGIQERDEELIETARREFLEETGIRPEAPFFDLGNVKQKGGKVVYAWAFSGDWQPETGIVCNTFSTERSPRSGKMSEFPVVDKVGWFDYDESTRMIIPAQIPCLERAKHYFALVK